MKYFLLLPLLFACSHGGFRSPSSQKEYFQVASLTPVSEESELKSAFQSLFRSRLEAQRAMIDFDAALQAQAGPFDLFAQPLYQNAMEVRASIEAKEHRLLEEVKQRLRDPQDREVREIFQSIQSRMAYRVLLNDFAVAMEDENIRTGYWNALRGEDLFAAAESTEGELREMAMQLGSGQEDAVAFTPKKKSRDLASLSVYPSTGPAGKISGEEFPSGVWALTYDDGPRAITTRPILANLKKHGMKATFFWLAKMVVADPAVVNAVKAEGHLLGNHSWSHPQLPKISAQEKFHEIVDSTAAETKIYGFKPQYFRCPYGAGVNNKDVRALIAGQNMVHVFWTVDSLDWQDKNPRTIMRRVKEQMDAQGRGVILFHDIHPQSVVATDKLMEEWSAEIKAGQKKFLTIGEAVDLLNGKRRPAEPRTIPAKSKLGP